MYLGIPRITATSFTCRENRAEELVSGRDGIVSHHHPFKMPFESSFESFKSFEFFERFQPFFICATSACHD